MRFEPYQPDELKFAYCYRVFFRFRTHRAKPIAELAGLTQPIAQAVVERFGLHILELAANPTDVLCLASLRPEETTAAAVSKIKGQTSKWLREAAKCGESEKLLSRGYFAVSTGQSTDESVQQYLQSQGEHHGYDDRWAKPPVFVETYLLTAEDEERLQTAHSHALLRLHCVLSTWQRRGVFNQPLAADVAKAWRGLMLEHSFALLKVSFVPDHVHLALQIHPTVSPAALICAIMNAAQETAAAQFARIVKPPAIERLWLPGAYLGAYGDLASPQITSYLHRWQSSQTD